MELLKRWQYILGLLLLLRKKPSPLELQKGLGLLSMVSIVSFVFFGVAIVKSKILSKWICGAGVVIGAVTIYAGLEVAYLGFSGLTTMIGISMIIYFVWVGILGGFMWKKSTSKSNQKA
jgi:hypothetical protein